MFTRLLIYPWAGGFKQANAIAEAIPNAYRILRQGSRYKYKDGDVVVNWGSSVRPQSLMGVKVLNRPEVVGKGKIHQYRLLEQAGIPSLKWTRDIDVARGWQGRDFKVVARAQDHGMGGAGITVYQPGDIIGPSLFYTRYQRKEREFRFHVFNGKVIFVQEKLKKKGVESAKYIRSHDRGWCFAFHHLRDNPPPVGGEEISISAVKCCDMDFGAVDVGWNGRDGYHVFEVNSAPGIEESSLNAYVETLRAL